MQLGRVTQLDRGRWASTSKVPVLSLAKAIRLGPCTLQDQMPSSIHVEYNEKRVTYFGPTLHSIIPLPYPIENYQTTPIYDDWYTLLSFRLRYPRNNG